MVEEKVRRIFGRSLGFLYFGYFANRFGEGIRGGINRAPNPQPLLFIPLLLAEKGQGDEVIRNDKSNVSTSAHSGAHKSRADVFSLHDAKP
jgi:hypothetical protein